MSLDCCFIEEVFRPLDCSFWAGRADRSPTNILRMRDLFKFDAMRRSIGITAMSLVRTRYQPVTRMLRTCKLSCLSASQSGAVA